MDGVEQATINLFVFNGCPGQQPRQDFTFSLEDKEIYDYQIQFRRSDQGREIVNLTRTVKQRDGQTIGTENYAYDLTAGHLDTPATSTRFLPFLLNLKMHLFRYGFRQKYSDGPGKKPEVNQFWDQLELGKVLDRTINDYLVFCHLPPLPEISAKSTLNLPSGLYDFIDLDETIRIVRQNGLYVGPTITWQYDRSTTEIFEIKTSKKYDPLLGVIPLGTELLLFEPVPDSKDPRVSRVSDSGMERAALMIMKDYDHFLKQALSSTEPVEPAKIRDILILYQWAGLVIAE